MLDNIPITRPGFTTGRTRLIISPTAEDLRAKKTGKTFLGNGGYKKLTSENLRFKPIGEHKHEKDIADTCFCAGHPLRMPIHVPLLQPLQERKPKDVPKQD